MTTTTPAEFRSSLPGIGVTQARVLQSEWTKFRTLRSSYITTAIIAIFVMGIGAIVCAAQAHHWPQASPHDKATFNPVFTSLIGVNFAELAVGVLGVMLFSGEYATGMIRSTMAAVPQRLPVLWAKLETFVGIISVVALISTVVAFFAGQSLLSSRGIQTSWSAHGVPREVIGAALYLVVVGIIAVSLGAITRNTAGGISSLVAIFFVIPPILNVLPTNWQNNIGPYLPGQAGQALWANPDGAHMAPWNGFAVMCAWAAAAVVLAAFLLRKRDS